MAMQGRASQIDGKSIGQGNHAGQLAREIDVKNGQGDAARAMRPGPSEPASKRPTQFRCLGEFTVERADRAGTIGCSSWQSEPAQCAGRADRSSWHDWLVELADRAGTIGWSSWHVELARLAGRAGTSSWLVELAG